MAKFANSLHLPDRFLQETDMQKKIALPSVSWGFNLLKSPTNQNVIVQCTCPHWKGALKRNVNHSHNRLWFAHWSPACLPCMYSQQISETAVYSQNQRRITAGSILSATAVCLNPGRYFRHTPRGLFWLTHKNKHSKLIFGVFKNDASKMGWDGRHVAFDCVYHPLLL